MLKSAVTSMAKFSRQTHINDPDQTALRGAVWSGSTLFTQRRLKWTNKL